MGKRSDGTFEKAPRGFYKTPEEPILRLLPHIMDVDVFAEPMCGDGAISRVLENRGWDCGFLSDLEPQGSVRNRAYVLDVMDLEPDDVEGCDRIISNPPWPLRASKAERRKRGDPTVSIIRHTMGILPCWYLLAADFAHNTYAADVIRHCRKIVSVGRVRWIEGTDSDGKDNAAWYLFDLDYKGLPEFHPLAPPSKLLHPSLGDIL